MEEAVCGNFGGLHPKRFLPFTIYFSRKVGFRNSSLLCIQKWTTRLQTLGLSCDVRVKFYFHLLNPVITH